MDLEKTMEFIVDNLADVSVKLGDLATKQARAERQMRGLQTLVKTGTKMMVKLQQEGVKARKEISQTQQELRDLAAAQKRTDEKFQRWLDRGSNGKTH